MASTIKTPHTEQVQHGIDQERIRQLEEAILSLSADIQNISSAVRDCQSMIIKIATNQQQLAERVSTWPFVKVEKIKRHPPSKPIDE